MEITLVSHWDTFIDADSVTNLCQFGHIYCLAFSKNNCHKISPMYRSNAQVKHVETTLENTLFAEAEFVTTSVRHSNHPRLRMTDRREAPQYYPPVQAADR